MILSKKTRSILLLHFLIFYSCQKSSLINPPIEKSQEQINKELNDYFKEEQLKNEKKWDSLQLKEDSLRNKSTLSGFIEDVPIFNQTTEVKK